MQNKYGLNYTYRNTAPKENVIFSNLAKDDPVIGIFSSSATGAGRHACVVIKDNPFSYFITVIDPMVGGVAASGSNGTFSYVSSATGNTLTLTAGLCTSWVYE